MYTLHIYNQTCQKDYSVESKGLQGITTRASSHSSSCNVILDHLHLCQKARVLNRQYLSPLSEFSQESYIMRHHVLHKYAIYI